MFFLNFFTTQMWFFIERFRCCVCWDSCCGSCGNSSKKVYSFWKKTKTNLNLGYLEMHRASGKFLNPFSTNVPLLYPLKTSEKLLHLDDWFGPKWMCSSIASKIRNKAYLQKKATLAQVTFCEFFMNIYFTEHLRTTAWHKKHWYFICNR